jgi:hypothetical protein
MILRINCDFFLPRAAFIDWIFVMKHTVVGFGVLTAGSMIGFGLLGCNGV